MFSAVQRVRSDTPAIETPELPGLSANWQWTVVLQSSWLSVSLQIRVFPRLIYWRVQLWVGCCVTVGTWDVQRVTNNNESAMTEASNHDHRPQCIIGSSAIYGTVEKWWLLTSDLSFDWFIHSVWPCTHFVSIFRRRDSLASPKPFWLRPNAVLDLQALPNKFES